MTPHEESTIKQQIIDIAAVVRDLTCMINPRPSTLDEEGQDWFEAKLKLCHSRMQDIVNDN